MSIAAETLLDNCLPELVYKFRSTTDPFHLRLLSDRIIYFSPFSTLNDPFDASLVYRYDLLTDEERREALRDHLRQSEPHLDTVQIEARADQSLLYQEGPLEFSKKSTERMRAFQENRIGVFSSSPNWDNLLMWSHYADAHRGFCVGLNPEAVMIAAEDRDPQRVWVQCRKVIYANDPNLYPLKESVLDRMARMYTTKYSGWEYEDEIRLLMFPQQKRTLDTNDRQVFLPELAIKEVILGSKMPPHHRDKIKLILKGYSHRPKLYAIDFVFGE